MSQQPEDKKPDFSNFPRGAIGIKGLPVVRNARLPSIRSPRDLTLGSQTKRTFTPNIPVRREKKPTDLVQDAGESTSKTPVRNSKNTSPKSDRGRGRGRGKGQIIQLEGAVFGEGIAPAALKGAASRQRESISRSEFTSGRPFVKKEKTEYDMHHMEQEMKMLLRDDFIDDGDDSNSGDESMKPVIFPAKIIKEKQEKNEKEEKAESFQNQDFAKTMGFDVEKIAKFIKKEKLDDTGPVTKPDLSRIPKNQITDLLTRRDSSFFLLQIPQCITTHASDYQSKAADTAASSEENKNLTTLASMPEGTIGKLQILKNGQVRVMIGSLPYYIDDMCQLIGKHELASMKIDSGSGDLVSLGSCEKALILEPDIDSLIPDSKDCKS